GPRWYGAWGSAAARREGDASVRAGAARRATVLFEDLHDAILAVQLALLQLLALELLFRRQIGLAVELGQLPLERQMFLVVRFQLAVMRQQRLYQLLVLFLHVISAGRHGRFTAVQPTCQNQRGCARRPTPECTVVRGPTPHR